MLIFWKKFNGLIEACIGFISFLFHGFTVSSCCFKICFIWDKVFKSGPSKVCGRQSLKNLKEYGLLKYIISLQIS